LAPIVTLEECQFLFDLESKVGAFSQSARPSAIGAFCSIKKDRDALRVDRADGFEDVLDHDRRQSHARLVHEQHAWPPQGSPHVYHPASRNGGTVGMGIPSPTRVESTRKSGASADALVA
jgi:hypothetical protein